MKPLIIGIDPGTTAAYGAIDFEGNVISIGSKKDFSISEMISTIMYLGDPIVIGTDKKEVPSFIRSISQKLGAKVFTPSYDTKKGEKKRIVKQNGFLKLTKNAHEIDALASAFFALSEYRPLVKKIMHTLNKQNLIDVMDEVIPLVILDSLSIHTAIQLIENKDTKEIEKIKKKRVRSLTPPKELTKLQKEILLLRIHNFRLKQKLMMLENQLHKEQNNKPDIDSETKKFLTFKENRILFFEKKIKKLEKDNLSLDSLNNRLNSFIADMNGKVLIKKLKNLGRSHFDLKQKSLNISDEDVLMVEDLSSVSSAVVNILDKKNIRILIQSNKSNKELGKKFIILPQKELRLIETDRYALVDSNELDRSVAHHKKNKKIDKDSLKDLVQEYRKKRVI
ncbi:MAG: DUF460 domain-containing protein [Nanoarchaeota archaeon]|nr:DUF460 domain-containing protein [Nanoarchaeota archaeon]